jgi:hypothetical protein
MLNVSAEQLRGLTLCLSKAGLIEGTTANKLKTAAPNGATIDYCIDGITYYFTDVDDIDMDACLVQPDLYSCLYLCTLNATSEADTTAGMTITKGLQRLTADITSKKNVLEWPQPPADECPVAAFRIDTDGGTFTCGSTDLAAVDTVTYYDLACIPDTPLTS